MSKEILTVGDLIKALKKCDPKLYINIYMGDPICDTFWINNIDDSMDDRVDIYIDGNP